MNDVKMIGPYYNSIPYSQKHGTPNLPYPGTQPWQWHGNYHPNGNQFLGEIDTHHYYNHHMWGLREQQPGTSNGSPIEWDGPSTSAAAAAAAAASVATVATANGYSGVHNFQQNHLTMGHQMLQTHAQHQHQINGAIVGNNQIGTVGGGGVASSSSSSSSGGSSVIGGGANSSGAVSNISPRASSRHITHLNDNVANGTAGVVGMPISPPITVSGSDISSPDNPIASSSPHLQHPTAGHHLNNSTGTQSPSSIVNTSSSSSTLNSNRTSPVKSQYYDWMKKPTYPAQPAPGKTRTKDKYRIVYSDFQRLELEKEYCSSRYITIRRKSEMAAFLDLSERQVKIWFQNRRAKERKMQKKDGNMLAVAQAQHHEYGNIMEPKQKLDHSLHLQHALHPMAAMSMPPMGLHPHHAHHHHPLHGHHSLVSAAAAHSHQLHQSQHAQMSAAAAAGVAPLPM